MTPPHPRSTLFPYTTLFRSTRLGAFRHDGHQALSKVRSSGNRGGALSAHRQKAHPQRSNRDDPAHARRSEEHTSELQSHSDLVCRLLLEKKKNSAKKIDCQK